MADQEMIQEKIGEAIGLEKAAQKAVEELDTRCQQIHRNRVSKVYIGLRRTVSHQARINFIYSYNGLRNYE